MVQDFAELIAGCELIPNEGTILPLFEDGSVSPSSMWGLAPVAPMHLGFDRLVIFQKLMIANGCKHTVLLADLHGMMTHDLTSADAYKRSLYYQHYLANCCGLDAEYVRGSEFQTRIDYVELLLSMTNETRIARVRETIPAGTYKHNKTDPALVSHYLYAIMQCVDVIYLGSNLVLADPAQKRVYALLQPYLEGGANTPFSRFRTIHPALAGFIYAPIGYDIRGRRLVESTAATRISIHETRESLEAKVNRMFAPPGNLSVPNGRVNALLEFFRSSVFPWQQEPVQVLAEDGQTYEYDNFVQFATAYEEQLLHPTECKKSLTEALWRRLGRIQASWAASLMTWVDIDRAINVSSRSNSFGSSG